MVDTVEIRLREATITDVALLRHWDEQQHVIDSDPNDDWNWEIELRRAPSWREQLIAEANGRAVGFIQIIDPAEEDSHYWGDVEPNMRAIDIWIGEVQDLGKGYGTVMMNLALERCFNDPNVISVLIDPLESNLRAHKFYERFGFALVGKKRFGSDDCLVFKLNRIHWKKGI